MSVMDACFSEQYLKVHHDSQIQIPKTPTKQSFVPPNGIAPHRKPLP